MSTEAVIGVIFGVCQIAQGVIILFIQRRFDTRLEQMQQEFQAQVNAVERKDKFRLAALDRRLDAHQKAYAFMGKLLDTFNLSEAHALRTERSREFRLFWDENALYLTKATRDAMMKGFGIWRAYPFSQISLQAIADRAERKTLVAEQEADWKQFQNVFSVIAKSVDLETVAEEITLHGTTDRLETDDKAIAS